MGTVNIESGKVNILEVSDEFETNVEGIVYYVSFYTEDDQLISIRNTVDGGAALPPTAPSKDGHSFDTWQWISGSTDINNITEDSSFKASYTINSYTVTFIDVDQTVLKIETVEYGSAATAPSHPDSQTYYDPDGWDSDYSNITNDMTVTAKYLVQLSAYTINIVSSPLEYGENAIIYVSKAIPSLPDIFRFLWSTSSLSFDNFTLSGTTNPVATIFNENTSLIDDSGSINCSVRASDGRTGFLTSQLIILKHLQYTVIFRDYNSTILKEELVNPGFDATPPTTPDRMYYDFTGWTEDYTNVTSNVDTMAMYVFDASEVEETTITSSLGTDNCTAKFYITNNSYLYLSLSYQKYYGIPPNQTLAGGGSIGISAGSTISITFENNSGSAEYLTLGGTTSYNSNTITIFSDYQYATEVCEEETTTT